MTRASDTARLVSGGAVINEASNDVDFRVESDGNANMLFVDGGNDAVVIGHNDSRATLFNTTATASLQIEGTSGNTAAMSIVRNSNDDNGPQFVLGKSNGTSNGAVTVVTDDALLGRISFQGADGTQTVEAGRIEGFVDGTPGADDMPGRLVFSTTVDGSSSPTEKGRFDNAGRFLVSCTTEPNNSTSGVQLSDPGDFSSSKFSAGATADARTAIQFLNGNGSVGTIQMSGTSTSYNTSSDYRLKENVVTDWDATTRLKQLKPSRFNFKADKDTTLDGFLAHEVSSIVPEAISGEKDAMKDESNVVLNSDGTVYTWGISKKMWEEGKLPTTDKDGKTVAPKYASDTTWVESKSVPDHQNIDQSKLVPLLTKSLQEALARIDTLEAEVAKLKG